MDQNNNDPKTWTLAQRARRVSKGQAKIFMTRSAGDEQRLTKLTQFLDKEKLAKTSELKFAQKLLVKRYGPGKSQAENAGEQRRISRDRSVTFDSTFITRPDVNVDGEGRSDRKISSSSPEIHRKISNTHSPGRGENSRNVSFTQPFGSGEITRKISSTQFLGSAEIPSRVADTETTVGRFPRSHWDDLHARRRSPTVRSLEQEDIIRGDTDGTRPRAISLNYPPLILPPIYKTDEQRSLPNGGGLRSRYSTSHIRSTGPGTGHTRKTSLGSYRYGTGIAASVDDTDTVEFDESLYNCRYLRRKNADE